MKPEERVQWVYQAEGSEDLAGRYSEWARDYERDIQQVFGYVVPDVTVEIASEYLRLNDKILDVGAGTGLAGVLLNRAGFRSLYALDMSRGMLDEAEKKGIYRELYEGTLGERIELETQSFDAIVAAGVFGPRQAPSSGFSELIRLTRPNGVLVFSIQLQHYKESDIRQVLDSHTRAGRWILEKVSESFQGLPRAEPDILYRIWVYRVVKN